MHENEIEELQKVQQLLQIERQEDLHQYEEQVLRSGITQRIKNGVTWYPIIINSTEIGIGEYLILEIERTSKTDLPHQFSSGKSIALFSNADDDRHKQISGIIKNVSANKMRIATTVDELPDWVDDGKLGINVLFDENSYKEMEIALQKVITAENNRLSKLRSVLYGTSKAEFLNDYNDISIKQLNDSQNKAVLNALNAVDVAIIHGPPGTGKTTTMVEVIKKVTESESQVLVCSPSNVAVDLLTEKLVKQGINVVRIGNPARVSDEVITSTLDSKITSHPYYKDLKGFFKRAEEFRSLAFKYKRNFGRAEREQRQLLFSESKSILKEARKLEDYIIQDQFEKAQVICCTPVGAASRNIRNLNFKTVFIDEAAQALEPMSWIPITRAERVIFAGDHFQLPPTVKSKNAEELKHTLFEKCINRQPEAAVMLDTQYRMNEKIMNFSNNEFYHGRLKAHPSVKDQILASLPDNQALSYPIEFIDTAGTGFNENINPETSSISNPEEADLLLKHLSSLLETCRNTESLTIGIISPYKEQVEHLKNVIALKPELETFLKQIKIKTIDGFQGQEKDIIYISMVRSNDEGEIGFLKDYRRMNVALTRAKKKLVVFGDSATLGQDKFYKDFLSYIESVDAYKSAWEFIG